MANALIKVDEEVNEEELKEEEKSIAPWVTWMREAAPYIHELRDKTFVIGLAGEMIEKGKLENFIHDISMVSAMGARIV
ncbi:MAG: N-acetylglutamate synthase, partial [Burkholderiales bacterium]|nr:N-acetylglutamate synthase [Burkholderiales bacterium]